MHDAPTTPRARAGCPSGAGRGSPRLVLAVATLTSLAALAAACGPGGPLRDGSAPPASTGREVEAPPESAGPTASTATTMAPPSTAAAPVASSAAPVAATPPRPSCPPVPASRPIAFVEGPELATAEPVFAPAVAKAQNTIDGWVRSQIDLGMKSIREAGAEIDPVGLAACLKQGTCGATAWCTLVRSDGPLLVVHCRSITQGSMGRPGHFGATFTFERRGNALRLLGPAELFPVAPRGWMSELDAACQRQGAEPFDAWIGPPTDIDILEPRANGLFVEPFAEQWQGSRCTVPYLQLSPLVHCGPLAMLYGADGVAAAEPTGEAWPLAFAQEEIDVTVDGVFVQTSRPTFWSKDPRRAAAAQEIDDALGEFVESVRTAAIAAKARQALASCTLSMSKAAIVSVLCEGSQYDPGAKWVEGFTYRLGEQATRIGPSELFAGRSAALAKLAGRCAAKREDADAAAAGPLELSDVMSFSLGRKAARVVVSRPVPTAGGPPTSAPTVCALPYQELGTNPAALSKPPNPGP